MGSDQLFHKKKIRKEKELARKKASRTPNKITYIVCEDTKSSPNYFKKMKEYLRLNTAHVCITSSKGSAPISVVDHAIELAKKSPYIDNILCVFDRDNHQSYEKAIDKLKNQKSKNTKYQAITSTPCYEIWLLLHFQYSTRPYYRSGNKSAADNLINDLEKMISYKKSDVDWFDNLIAKLDDAMENAKKLEEHNSKTKSNNPSTEIHKLIEHLYHLKSSSALL